VWQVRGGQYAYTGHVCNFARDTSNLFDRLPVLPEHCEIIILRRASTGNPADELPFEDFRVRRHVIREWLEYLSQNHPTFLSNQVTIDEDRLSQLAPSELVHPRIQTIDDDGLNLLDNHNFEQGPPQDNDTEVSINLCKWMHQC
jgi:hypothetical protein